MDHRIIVQNVEEEEVIYLDSVRKLLCGVIERAVRDLFISPSNISPFDFQTAFDFLFDDTYRIQYGDRTFSLDEILEIVDIDKDYLRGRVKRQMYSQRKELAVRLFG